MFSFGWNRKTETKCITLHSQPLYWLDNWLYHFPDKVSYLLHKLTTGYLWFYCRTCEEQNGYCRPTSPSFSKFAKWVMHEYCFNKLKIIEIRLILFCLWLWYFSKQAGKLKHTQVNKNFSYLDKTYIMLPYNNLKYFLLYDKEKSLH